MSDVPGVATPLDVHIVTPEREVWAGEATFVLARSAGGDLGILPGHEPVLALLGAGPLRIRTTGQDEEWGVQGGFLSVATTGGQTRVDVLAEHVTNNASDVTPSSGVEALDAEGEGTDPREVLDS